MKVYVFYGNQPCLNIKTETTPGPNCGVEYGLNRDRNPDSGWGELRSTRISDAKLVELDADIYDNEIKKLKIILLEDLAYTYGNDTVNFNKKLKEFNFI